MSPDAKKALASTIRALRARLLEDLHDATEATYRLSVRARESGLSEAALVRRKRLEDQVEEQLRAEVEGVLATRRKGTWSDERVAEEREKLHASLVKSGVADRLRRDIEKQAAYTLLNRLVVLRLMEAGGLRAPAVVTGGWESRGYKDFRTLAPALVRDDATEGYALLLQLVFEDLAVELPGIFGAAGLADLVPIPAATLRHAIEALDDDALASCWADDMTLGWVYQYWNDPEREALDAKLNAGGKVEPHEIASKTQMFTERYMVDWLLQNSLGPMWLAMCQKQGWTPEVESDGTLDALEARRVEWRAKRAAGEVELTALMPLHSDAERRWAYYVPQPIPEDAVARAPDTVRDLKLLDPAVGSGHFLVIALDLLVALYREEARHRGEAGDPKWTDRAIVERILSHNLHGIDLDPRAVQIAAAALWLKARTVAPDATPERLNLVASNLRLASLPDDDPALVELQREVARETGIPGELTDTLVHALRGADHLGSLLKVDHAVEEALDAHESEAGRAEPEQGGLFTGFGERRERKAIDRVEAKATLLDRLEGFLEEHTGGEDLGLRLRGEQLAAGVRFVRMVREGTYDLVVANPPYQGTSKMADSKYIEKVYPLGKADLYAAFLLRGLELVREGGVSSMLTMRNWMFIKQYAEYRENLFANHSLRAIGDVSWGAFREMRDNPVTMSVVMRGVSAAMAVAVAPTDPQERVRTQEEFAKKEAGLLCHEGRHTFDPAALKVVPEWPLVYWWDEGDLRLYRDNWLFQDHARARKGIDTGSNTRFTRRPWEVAVQGMGLIHGRLCWVPYIMGSKGVEWIEPLQNLVMWSDAGFSIRMRAEISSGTTIRNPDYFFRRGVAFAPIGAKFSARVHRYDSICDNMGTSSFPPVEELAHTVCVLNSAKAASILEALNPGVHFQAGDVNRLPGWRTRGAEEIVSRLEDAFSLRESHREPSSEFLRPDSSPWRHAQEWAQAAVDRPEGAPLPEYVQELDPEPPTDHLSFALGVALGRFGPDGEGILDPDTAALSHALPHGILFLDTTLDATDRRDGLGHPAAEPLHTAWAEHGPAIGTKRGLRDWLALDFFKDVHRTMYENRPIHWPLSSSGKTFVAWVNIHRFTDQTLQVLLADHLVPTLTRIEGELDDLRAARDGADAKAARTAEKQLDRVLKARDELRDFIASVEACADRGPRPTDEKCPAREQDARYAPDLDDGVMINSAALWPLLDPQWKDPKKWWKELATAKGRKDYDWAHLAMRYWPTRVDAKCKDDPSLGVAHGCFWRAHPERAWAWELRLQDEIGPDFRIEEAPYRPGGRELGDAGDGPHRAAYLRDAPEAALAAIEKEAVRRMGRGKSRKAVEAFALLESGLWTAHAEALWDLELRLSEKQGLELRITAPDEPDARAAFEAAHPERVREREELVAGLVPPPDLFDENADEEASDDEPDAGEEDDE